MTHDELQAAANKTLWWGGALVAVVALWGRICSGVGVIWGFVAMPFRLVKKLNESVEQLTKVVASLESTMNGKVGALDGRMTVIHDAAFVAYRYSLLHFDNATTAHFECAWPSGECTYVNHALSKLFGLEPEHCRGFGWANAIHPDDAARVKEYWLQCIEHWRGYKCRYRIVRQDETLTVDASAIIITDEAGKPIRLWGTVTKMPIHT